MLLLPGNYSGWFVHYWAGRCPGLFGHLWCPPRSIDLYPHLDFACDNYRYAAYMKGQRWSAEGFRQWVKQLKWLSKSPLFLVVPDVPMNARATLAEWSVWEAELRALNIPLAFALQDGIEIEQVPGSADWLFVGGTDGWRYPRLREFTSLGKPVHVGRVNSVRRIEQCDQAGVSSVDGSSWFRDSFQQDLIPYLHYRVKRYQESLVQPTEGGGVGEAGSAEGSGSAVPLAMEQALLLPPSPEQLPRMRHWQQQRIPANIERWHLERAAKEWGLWSSQWTCRVHASQRYWVRVGERFYPPKRLISVANVYANGVLLPVHSFSGGRETERFLRLRGLEVVEL